MKNKSYSKEGTREAVHCSVSERKQVYLTVEHTLHLALQA